MITKIGKNKYQVDVVDEKLQAIDEKIAILAKGIDRQKLTEEEKQKLEKKLVTDLRK